MADCNYPKDRTQGIVVKLQVLGLTLGIDFTFTLDNNHNHIPHTFSKSIQIPLNPLESLIFPLIP